MTLTGSSHKGGALAQFRQVYCWQLKKNRTLSIAYGALTLLCFTILYLCRGAELYQSYFRSVGDEWEGVSQASRLAMFSEEMAGKFSQQTCLILIPLSLLFLVTFSVSAFGYMHRRRSVDLFHALPLRRTPLLLGNLAAGYTVLVLVVGINSLLCGAVALIMGAEAPFRLSWLLQSVGYQLLLLAAALVLTLFLLVASGTLVNAVLSGILLSISWPVLCYCGASVIRMTLPGSTLTPSAEVATALVPYLAVFLPFLNSVIGYLPSGLEYGAANSYQGTMPLVIWWCVLTAVLLAASILLYRKRKSECAENNFSFPVLRGVIQFLVSGAFGLGCGLVFGDILQQNWVFFLAVLIGSAVAHVISQILWMKGTRQFKKGLPVYGALMVCLCLFFVGLASGGLGYVTRIPNPTRVESVTLEMPDYYYDDSRESYLGRYSGFSVWNESSDTEGRVEEEDYYLEVKPRLTEQESVEQVKTMHEAVVDYYDTPYLPFQNELDQYQNYSCFLRYQLSDGRTLERTYYLPVPETDSSSGETVQKLEFPQETLEKMAAVIALDEYQAYSAHSYQNADQIIEVRTNRVEMKGEYSGYQELTRKQKNKLWDTFQKELNSDQFRYTARDNSGVTTDGETSYYISMESTGQYNNWPDGLKELLMDQIKEHFPEKYWEHLTIESGGETDLNIPESCTKTRKLIKEYIGDSLEYIPYDDKE